MHVLLKHSGLYNMQHLSALLITIKYFYYYFFRDLLAVSVLIISPGMIR